MKRSSSTTKTTKARQLSPEGLSRALLAVLFSFFFLYSQASDFAITSVEDCQPEHIASFQGDYLLGDHHQRQHFPPNSVPTPTESESKDEREKNHESDDDENKVPAIVSLKERLNVISCKSLLLHLLHSRENRKQLSLFVLHHSWKSFLS
jgi:hypothetical protein